MESAGLPGKARARAGFASLNACLPLLRTSTSRRWNHGAVLAGTDNVLGAHGELSRLNRGTLWPTLAGRVELSRNRRFGRASRRVIQAPPRFLGCTKHDRSSSCHPSDIRLLRDLERRARRLACAHPSVEPAVPRCSEARCGERGTTTLPDCRQRRGSRPLEGWRSAKPPRRQGSPEQLAGNHSLMRKVPSGLMGTSRQRPRAQRAAC